MNTISFFILHTTHYGCVSDRTFKFKLHSSVFIYSFNYVMNKHPQRTFALLYFLQQKKKVFNSALQSELDFHFPTVHLQLHLEANHKAFSFEFPLVKLQKLLCISVLNFFPFLQNLSSYLFSKFFKTFLRQNRFILGISFLLKMLILFIFSFPRLR